MLEEDALRERIRSVTGRADVEIIGGAEPIIKGFVNLIEDGLIGGYVIFEDATGKTLAAPVPFGLGPSSFYKERE
jgi:hypothetical protein